MFGGAILPRPDLSKLTHSCIVYMLVDYMYVCVCVRACAGGRVHLNTHEVGQKNKYRMWDLRFSQRCWASLSSGCYIKRPDSASLQCIYFVSSLFSSLITIHIKFFCCPTLVPSATVETLVSWDSLVYCLLLDLFVLCYQPSCQFCFHLAAIFGSVGVRSLRQRWKQMKIARRRTPLMQSQRR